MRVKLEYPNKTTKNQHPHVSAVWWISIRKMPVQALNAPRVSTKPVSLSQPVFFFFYGLFQQAEGKRVLWKASSCMKNSFLSLSSFVPSFCLICSSGGFASKPTCSKCSLNDPGLFPSQTTWDPDDACFLNTALLSPSSPSLCRITLRLGGNWRPTVRHVLRRVSLIDSCLFPQHSSGLGSKQCALTRRFLVDAHRPFERWSVRRVAL